MCVCRERPSHNPHCCCWGRSVQVTVLHVKTVKTLLNRKSWKLEHEQDGKVSLETCKITNFNNIGQAILALYLIWSFMFSVTVKTFFCVRKRKFYSASGSSAKGSGHHVCSSSYIIFKIKVENILGLLTKKVSLVGVKVKYLPLLFMICLMMASHLKYHIKGFLQIHALKFILFVNKIQSSLCST